MNIYLTKSLQNKIQLRTENEQIHQPGCTIYVFCNFRTPKNSILKQLEIKIVGDHSRFQKLQIDKQEKTYVFKTL